MSYYLFYLKATKKQFNEGNSSLSCHSNLVACICKKLNEICWTKYLRSSGGWIFQLLLNTIYLFKRIAPQLEQWISYYLLHVTASIITKREVKQRKFNFVLPFKPCVRFCKKLNEFSKRNIWEFFEGWIFQLLNTTCPNEYLQKWTVSVKHGYHIYAVTVMACSSNEKNHC